MQPGNYCDSRGAKLLPNLGKRLATFSTSAGSRYLGPTENHVVRPSLSSLAANSAGTMGHDQLPKTLRDVVPAFPQRSKFEGDQPPRARPCSGELKHAGSFQQKNAQRGIWLCTTKSTIPHSI